MCGIIGGINNSRFKYDLGLKAMNYRGPDGYKLVERDNVVLGFVRLAIRDLSDKAMQPMVNETEDVYILFNGEIYAVDSLREELGQEYLFKTTSDTEVILNAYLKYGENFVDIIDGMFAIVIVDFAKNKILLYRDRVGIKPVYYWLEGNNFVFSSELKGIINTINGTYPLQLDNTAIYDYFSYGYIPDPKTMYQGIYKLEPAHMATFDLNDNSIDYRRYWELNVNPEEGVFSENRAEEAKEIVLEAVREQMVADVKVGNFLSGGIDSSIIALCTKELGYDIDHFSIGFHTQIGEEVYNELPYAELLAEEFNLILHSEYFGKNDLWLLDDDLTEWFDEPYACRSCYPAFFVSRLARNHSCKVVLTGDGGDEIFGGYYRYSEYARISNNIKRNGISELYYYCVYPRFRKYSKRLLDDIIKYGIQVDWYGEKNKRRRLEKIGIKVPNDYDDFWYIRKYYNSELPPITRAQVVDFYTYLPCACLQKTDRTTMINSIEGRVPFCDKKVVEFAFSLSQNERCTSDNLKGLLKTAFSDDLPHKIITKEKKGFSYPSSYDKRLESIWDYRYDLYKKYVKKYLI